MASKPTGWNLSVQRTAISADSFSFTRPVHHGAPPVTRPGHRRFENPASRLYNFQQNSLPDATSNPSPSSKPGGWSLVAAGFLLLALALVVIYTNRRAFLSPLALVVVAAIGLAALLLQLRLRKDVNASIHAPLWLNVLGLIFAISAVLADMLRLSANFLFSTALGAVLCFAVSGIFVLHALRRRKS
jgi:hypothetical protein